MPEFSTVDIADGIWLVTISRPERMNALHPPANFELADIFAQFAADPDARVAILTGVGERAFCAGNDLRYLAEGHPRRVPELGFAGLTANYQRSKPVIADNYRRLVEAQAGVARPPWVGRAISINARKPRG